MGIAEFLYTVVLKPRPLRVAANGLIRMLIPVQLHRQGAIVVLNSNDPVISGALTLRVYERKETRFFRKLCREGITFVDIRANLGYYTALALEPIGGGRIVAFEPDPENYQFPERTVAANGARM